MIVDRLVRIFITLALMAGLYFSYKVAKKNEREMKIIHEQLCTEVYEPGTEDYDRNCLPWWEYLSGHKSKKEGEL